MMPIRTGLIVFCCLFASAAQAQDEYDALYVSDTAVCERADEDMGDVLFELQAAAVAPRIGIWMGGELSCRLADVRMNPPVWGWGSDEVYATARCEAPYLAFVDRVRKPDGR